MQTVNSFASVSKFLAWAQHEEDDDEDDDDVDDDDGGCSKKSTPIMLPLRSPKILNSKFSGFEEQQRLPHSKRIIDPTFNNRQYGPIASILASGT